MTCHSWKPIRLLAIFTLFLSLLIPATIAQPSVDKAYAQGLNPQCSASPETMWVERRSYYNDNPNQPYYIYAGMDPYLMGVLIGELGGDGWWLPWHHENQRALAVAARTYATYWCHKRLLGNGQYGLWDNAYDQVYRPWLPGSAGFAQDRLEQAEATTGIYMTYDGIVIDPPYNGVVAVAEYRADSGNPTQDYGAGYPHLRSVNDPRSTQPTTGPGYSQMPGNLWARDPYNWSWQAILYHYYTGVYFQSTTHDFYGEYHTGLDPLAPGTLVGTRYETPINFDWGGGSPMTGVPNDNFSVHWTGEMYVPESSWYTFYVLSDDGVQLRIENNLILDEWRDQAPSLFSGMIYLDPGWHDIDLRYYEHTGGAVIRLSWMKGIGLIGRYYTNTRIAHYSPDPAVATMVRPDTPINYNWMDLSPKDTRPLPSVISSDNFSVIWRGKMFVRTCTWHNFSVTTDDGFMLHIRDPWGNNFYDIDQWHDQGPTTYTYNRWLCPGPAPYDVEARYYENGGWATAKLSWDGQ